MTTTTVLPTDQYRAEIDAALTKLCTRAKIPMITGYKLDWSLRGVSRFAVASIRPNGMSAPTLGISLNEGVFQTLGYEQYRTTVLHEACHLFVYWLMFHKKVRYVKGRRDQWSAHGGQWQSAMRSIGQTPNRCAGQQESAQVTATLGKARSKMPVYCNCMTHHVSLVVWRRLASGQSYTCRLCKSSITTTKGA